MPTFWQQTARAEGPVGCRVLLLQPAARQASACQSWVGGREGTWQLAHGTRVGAWVGGEVAEVAAGRCTQQLRAAAVSDAGGSMTLLQRHGVHHSSCNSTWRAGG